MIGLLAHTKERIDSLEQFYISELVSIERKSKKGMKTHQLAHLMDLYFKMLASSNEEYKAGDSFKALERYVQKRIVVENVETKEDIQKVEFVWKDNKINKDLPENFDIKKGAIAYRKYADMPQIHSNNTLIMLLIRFEEFISRFFSSLYSMYPQKYLDNQCVVFSEISSLGVSEIKKNIIEREVEMVMRENYREWFKIFESHKMNFSKCNKEMEALNEIYSRRNILVHNQGVVNSTYLKNVSNTTLKCGDVLNTDKEYLEGAFNTVKKIIFAIVIEANRFFKNQELLEEAFVEGYEELLNENYVVSQKVFDSLRAIEKQQDGRKYMSNINYWISTKELNGLESIKSDVETFDTSALETMFDLAKMLLLDNYDIASIMVDSLIRDKKLPAIILNEWPMFKRFRKTEYFEKIKTEYADLFSSSIVETESNTNLPKMNIRSELAEVDK